VRGLPAQLPSLRASFGGRTSVVVLNEEGSLAGSKISQQNQAISLAVILSAPTNEKWLIESRRESEALCRENVERFRGRFPGRRRRRRRRRHFIRLRVLARAFTRRPFAALFPGAGRRLRSSSAGFSRCYGAGGVGRLRAAASASSREEQDIADACCESKDRIASVALRHMRGNR